MLDWVLFEDDTDPLSHAVLYDRAHCREIGGASGGLISLAFLELPKPREQALGDVVHWMDFFAGRSLASDAPGYFEAASRLVSEQDLTREEIEMVDAQAIGRQDRIEQLAASREEGFEEGSQQTQLDIARVALLKGSSPEFVAEITGLDQSEVTRLKAELEN